MHWEIIWKGTPPVKQNQMEAKMLRGKVIIWGKEPSINNVESPTEDFMLICLHACNGYEMEIQNYSLILSLFIVIGASFLDENICS